LGSPQDFTEELSVTGYTHFWPSGRQTLLGFSRFVVWNYTSIQAARALRRGIDPHPLVVVRGH